MTKWYYQKNANKNAEKNPYYYQDKKLVKTTKLDFDREKKSAWKWK